MNQLLIETQEILEEARELLARLPPLSRDHESVRLAVVKLRRAQAKLLDKRDVTSKTLAYSRTTMDEARVAIKEVRDSGSSRSRRHPIADLARNDGGGDGVARASNGPTTVFLDADTVLLAQHRGRYGPELGLQAGLSDAIERLFEITDRVVVTVNPPSSTNGHHMDTEHRLAALREGIGKSWDGLVMATCPHGENGDCTCAKPGHGLITPHLASGRRANSGWYVGGDQEGMVAGRSAGLRTVRIGPHGEDHLSVVHRPDYEARDLMDAANHIMVEALA